MISSVSSARLASVLDAIEDPVRVVDKSHKVVLANKAMLNAAELSLDCNCFSFFGNEPCDGCLSDRVFKTGASVRGTRHFGGVLYDVKAAPYADEKGEIIGAVEVFRDITKLTSLKKAITTSQIKMDRDMGMAKKLQTSMLRKELPSPEGYLFSNGFFPCEAIGGDMFDCFYIPDGRVFMYVADVCGHGLVPSMLTAFLKQSVFSLAKNIGAEPSRLLWQMFSDFAELNADDTLYVTLFVALLDPDTGFVSYSNAGLSVAPLLVSNGVITELALPGMPISRWTDAPRYNTGYCRIQPGDRLMLFTDGLLSAPQEFIDGLPERFASAGFSGQAFIDDIEKNHRHEFADDLTLLICERNA